MLPKDHLFANIIITGNKIKTNEIKEQVPKDISNDRDIYCKFDVELDPRIKERKNGCLTNLIGTKIVKKDDSNYENT